MTTTDIKQSLLRAVEPLSGVGYFLVIASILYFIIGAVVGLVGGDMLKWTFCGSAHHLIGVEWCSWQPQIGWAWGSMFLHKLVNAALPWVMMVTGLFILAVTLPAMKALGFQYKTRDNRDA